MSDKKPKGSLLGEVVFDGNDYSDEEKYEKAFNELLISTLKTLVIAGMSFEGPSMKLRTKKHQSYGRPGDDHYGGHPHGAGFYGG
jgi:hypothetical protein